MLTTVDASGSGARDGEGRPGEVESASASTEPADLAADATAGRSSLARGARVRHGPRVPRRARRVLATVLFFDVVQSTALASELGDKRWGELLVQMRRAVSRELKRGGGREQDFSGDGFLVVFSEPAQAVRTATTIIGSLHELGLDVRCGVHAGECQVIDGKMRGIAVHIGARVMALAGAAEVLVTGTVRDLVVGSGIRFDEVGVHELKGVEGAWLVYRAVEVDGNPVTQPLARETALATIGALDLARGGRRQRLKIAAAVAVIAAAAAVAVPLLVFGGGSAASRFGTNSLVRIDPRTGHALKVVSDPHAVADTPTHVFSYRGTLWNWDNNYGFIRWDMQTGQQLAAFGDRKVAGCPYEPGWDIALGTIWLWCNSDVNGSPPWWLVRLDELSYRHLATVRLPHSFLTVASAGWGLGAYWVVDDVGHLVRVDALTSRIAGTYSTPILALSSCRNPGWYPGVVGPVVTGGVLWFAQCNPNELIAFNPATRRASTFAIPQEVGWLLAVPAAPDTVWLFDPYGGTLTPFSTRLKRMGEPTALPGTPESTTVTNDAIWVAAGNVVDRVPTIGPQVVTTIPLPKGVWASSIAVDPSTSTLWVTNNTYARSNPQWAGPSGP
jgi:class 3 adenylate cyclase